MPTYSFLDTQGGLIGPGGTLDFSAGSGIAEEGITIERAGDKNKMDIGADGTGQHTLRADKSGTVTIRTLKTSTLNQQMAVLYDFQSASSAVWGKNVISVRNTGSGDSHTCQQCAFKKFTNNTYAKDANMNEWSFDVVRIDSVLGAGS